MLSLEIKGLRSEMVSFKTELRAEIAESFEEMRGELASFKTNIRDELGQFKASVKGECVDLIQHEFQRGNKVRKSQDDKLKWMAIEGEARNKLNNLLCHGINEKKEENCEKVLLDFIKKELKLDSTVVLQRMHQLGGQKVARTLAEVLTSLGQSSQTS